MPYKNKDHRRLRTKDRLKNDPDYYNKYHGWQKKARERKTTWYRSLKNKPCQICNQSFHPVCMDFHHKDPKEKNFDVSRLSYSKKKTLEEIAKCILVCANCHRLIEEGLVSVSCPLNDSTS